MAGLTALSPTPTAITVHEKSRTLEVVFSDAAVFQLPLELLRVYSPSAEVQGHGPGQEVLQTGKRDVVLLGLDAVGNYAVKPIFSDGHDTGIYSWDYLYQLGKNQSDLWQSYLDRLQAAGLSRDLPMPASKTGAGHGGGCSSGGHASVS